MSETQQRPSLQERAEIEREATANKTADKVGIKSQHQEVAERKFNPDFLEKLQDIDLDSEKHPWIEDLLGPDVSGAHILGNRSEQYEQQQTWLNENKAERVVAERTPGRLLRQHEDLHAFWQGLDSADHPDYNAAIERQEERRQVRSAYEAATTFQSLGIEGKGVDSVTTATTENRTVSQDEQESKSVRERIAAKL